MPDVIPLRSRQPLNAAAVGDITAQQMIPGVLDIPKREVKRLAKERGDNLLAMEPLRQDEVEGDHRQLAEMPKEQAIELTLDEIDQLATTLELRLLSRGLHRNAAYGFHVTLALSLFILHKEPIPVFSLSGSAAGFRSPIAEVDVIPVKITGGRKRCVILFYLWQHSIH